jgi:hypothetical protein
MVRANLGGTMLIATFGPTTAWVGKTITREGDAFLLEGYGRISAGDIMEYDRQGHLAWANDGTRAWVGSKAKGLRASSATPAITIVTPRKSKARGARTGVDSQPSSRKKTHLKRGLLVAIFVLVVTNVVLILTILGTFRGL